MPHVCMSHVTSIKESCLGYVTHVHESHHINMWDMLHVWVMPHVWMSHVTSINESHHTHVSCRTCAWVTSHQYMSHITRVLSTHSQFYLGLHTLNILVHFTTVQTPEPLLRLECRQPPILFKKIKNNTTTKTWAFLEAKIATLPQTKK